METDSYETILALDVGERRIGVARAQLAAPFPSSLTTLDMPESFIEDIVMLCKKEKAGALVVGLPRGLSGQETQQTAFVQNFAKQLELVLDIPLYWIDEALSSVNAETELRERGRPYQKADIDALAAVFILEDFIKDNPGVVHHG